MGLARDSDLFAAGVDIHGVHDWSARVGRGPGGGSPELVKLARESSPISSVDKWKSPVLLIHGDDDRNVAFSQTVDLVRKLREHGIYYEELVLRTKCMTSWCTRMAGITRPLTLTESRGRGR
jgi:dipeptidyl aminopeptidase/acylaminoacyl peptidase